MDEVARVHLYWVPRYAFGDRLRHIESGKLVIVKDFQHLTYYKIVHEVVVPAYVVYVMGDEREAWVSEDELGPR